MRCVIYSSQGPRHAFAALEGKGFISRLLHQILRDFAGITILTIDASPPNARSMVRVIRVARGIEDRAVRRGLDVLGFQD